MIDEMPNDERELASLFDQLAIIIQENNESSVEKFLKANERFEPQLRSLLPTIRAMVGIGNEPLDASETVEHDLPPLEHTQRELGDFQLVREIGRGGMGIVYEAYQRSMGRRVAVKILPFAAVIDPRQVHRFRNEVRAAAALQHQNIVPVYSVGCEKGVHFYAMQFVEGATLTEIIAGLRSDKRHAYTEGLGYLKQMNAQPPLGDSESLVSNNSVGSGLSETRWLSKLSTARTGNRNSWYRSVTHLMIQASEALAHAHSRGVLHRDIKPGNLMVDSTGNLWISDFGLARLEVDAGITMTGDVIGTLRYLSPEQSKGSSALIDERSDVYSLGATMYELLALRPAFDGEDRHALLRQIAEENPKPLRKLDPLVPRELEIIVQKAMDKSAADRYSTAEEMANDLTRFANRRPILAQPPTLVVRLRKWSQRHIGLVWTSIVTLSLTVVFLSISALFISSSRNEARRAEAIARIRLERALEAEMRAEQHAQEADAAKRESNALLYAADVRLAADGLKNGTLGRAVERLTRHVPNGDAVDRRGFAWNYLWDQLHPEIATWKTEDANRCLRYSPDGRLIAIGMETGLVTLRDSDSGEVLRHLRLHSNDIQDLAFSPDGELLATADDAGQIGIWNLPRPELVTSFSADGESADAVAWSADGSTLFYASGDFVYGWSVANRNGLGRLGPHPGAIYDIDLSADGRSLAVASSTATHNRTGQVTLWDVSDLHPTKWRGPLPTPKELPCRHKCTSVAISHHGSFIAAGTQIGQLLVWDAENPTQQLQKLQLQTSNIYDISFSRDDSLLATASKDGTVCVCQTRTWDSIASLQGHSGRVYGVDFSPDDKIFATASTDASIKIWPALYDRFTLQAISPLRSERIEVDQASNQIAIASARDFSGETQSISSPVHVFELFPNYACTWLDSHRIATLPQIALRPDRNGSAAASGVLSGDLDADGDVDRFSGFASSHRMVWQENQGDVWLPPRLFSSGIPFSDLRLAHRLVPQEEPFEIGTDYAGSVVRIIDNGPKDSRRPVVKTSRRMPYPTAIDVADLNADGRKDLVFASRLPGSIQACLQSKVSSSETFFDEFHTCVSLPDASVVKVITGDSPGAGDLAAGSLKSQELVVLKNLGSAEFEVRQRLSTDPVRPLAIAEIDMNQDGKLDLIVGGTEGLRYFKRKSDEYEPESVEITTLKGALWTRSLAPNVQIIDAKSRKLLQQFHSGDNQLRSIAASTDGARLATISRTWILRIWNTHGHQLDAIDMGNTRIHYLEFDRVGHRLALAKGDDVVVFELENRMRQQTLKHHLNTVQQVCFSNDNDLLLSTSGDLTAIIWDINKGTPRKKLSGHAFPVTSGVFSQDDQLVATGDESGVVRIWDVYTGQQLLELKDFPYTVRAIRFVSSRQLKVWGNIFKSPSTATYEGTWQVGSSKWNHEEVHIDLQ